jgi:hypothetical protein
MREYIDYSKEGQEVDIFVWLTPDIGEWITVTIIKAEDAPQYYACKDEGSSYFAKVPGRRLTLRFPDGSIRGPRWWSPDEIRDPVW